MKKLAFITWWANWIWAACAKKFTKLWYQVAINYLSSQEEAYRLKNNLQDSGIFQWDMSEQKDIERVFNEIKNQYWMFPNVLINNAWIVGRVKFPKLDWDKFANVLKINTIWPYLVTREFLKRHGENLEWKSVIFLGSMRGWPESSSSSSIDYSASKAAIHNMVSSLAKLCSPCRVNWVAPWFTETPMHEWNLDRLNQEAGKSILKRYSSAEDIADSVYFLSSDQAKSITGQVLRVDNWRSLMS